MTIPSNTQIEGLISRVKAATGPDRELDADVMINLGCVEDAEWDIIIGKDVINKLAGRTYSHPAPVTASIDAALALVERVLPDAGYMFQRPRKGWERRPGLHGFSSIGLGDPLRTFHADAPTAPLAILLALLQALKDTSS